MTSKRSLRFPIIVVCCVVLASAAGACSSDSTDHPASVSSAGAEQVGGRAGSAGHVGNAGGEAGASPGGEGGSSPSTANGDAGDAAAGDVGSGRPPLAPSACSEMAHWSGSSAVASVSSAADETLLSVTPDELDLAFLRSGTLYVAHRAQASADFSVGAAVAIPAGWSAAQGAGLSADGKRLVLVSDPDQKKLGELTRASRGDAFAGAVDETAFQGINDDSVYTGKLYAYPVVSPGDDQLFFNSAFPMSASTVVVATRSGTSTWSAPVQLTSKLLDGGATTRRLPSGVSADARTLFYFNEESMAEEARFRDTPSITSPLYDMVSLGARRGATPNIACNRLYSSATGDVVVEND